MSRTPTFVIVCRSSCIFEVHRLVTGDSGYYTLIASCQALNEARQVRDALERDR